jgi:hypothetical protein
MRLQSHIWISALLRSQAASGAYATILRKGAPEAGAIIILHNHLDGTLSVYAPVPQSAFMDTDQSGRIFEKRFDHCESAEIERWLDQQVRFDFDCWIVEIEQRESELSLPPG